MHIMHESRESDPVDIQKVALEKTPILYKPYIYIKAKHETDDCMPQSDIQDKSCESLP